MTEQTSNKIVKAGAKTYFFDLKRTKEGKPFLVITESQFKGENQERERAVLGCSDIAMRKYIPPDILCLTVAPRHFERMLDVPDGAFLDGEWWKDLMRSRGKSKDP